MVIILEYGAGGNMQKGTSLNIIALLNYMTIREPETRIFSGVFSLNISNFAGRISEAAMGGACRRAARPVLRLKEPKKTGVRNARARSAAKTH